MRLLGRQTKASGQKLNCNKASIQAAAFPTKKWQLWHYPFLAPHLQQTQFRLERCRCRAKGRAMLRSHGKRGNRNRPGESWAARDKSFCGRSTRLAQKEALCLEQEWNSKPQPHMLLKRNCGVGTKLINIASCLDNPTKKPEFSAQERWPVPGQHVWIFRLGNTIKRDAERASIPIRPCQVEWKGNGG